MAQNGLFKRFGIGAIVLASFGAGLFASYISRGFRTSNHISASNVLEEKIEKNEPVEIVEEKPAPENHDSEVLERIVNMKNSKGGNLFNSRVDAAFNLDAGGSADEIESLSRILTEDGKRIFDQGQYITDF